MLHMEIFIALNGEEELEVKQIKSHIRLEVII
jgi:hypothetical protein